MLYYQYLPDKHENQFGILLGRRCWGLVSSFMKQFLIDIRCLTFPSSKEAQRSRMTSAWLCCIGSCHNIFFKKSIQGFKANLMEMIGTACAVAKLGGLCLMFPALAYPAACFSLITSIYISSSDKCKWKLSRINNFILTKPLVAPHGNSLFFN